MALAQDKTGYDEALHKPRLCKDCGSFVFLLRPTAAAPKHREAKCYDCVKKTEAKRLADCAQALSWHPQSRPPNLCGRPLHTHV